MSCGCPRSSEQKCAVLACKNYDEFYNLLLNCARKTIGNHADCPSIRSCPHCKEAIEHTEACNNMECRSCGKHFCFICLAPGSGGNLTCSSNSHKVAPVQIIS